MTRAATATIDLQALQHNLRRVREAAKDSHIISVIKAGGYGHGMVRVATALQESDAFAVAKIEEALALRESGIDKPILLLEGFIDRDELQLLSRHAISAVVHHPRQIELLETASLERPIEVWLKVDTGMHRLGIPVDNVATSFNRLRACVNVANSIVMMTHFARADERDHPATAQQLELFQAATAGIDAPCSLANSAAILVHPRSHAAWVRPGIMLYGVSPFIDGSAENDGLRPVMALRSRLIAVNRCKRGDSIGYGGGWRCPEDMTVGVVAIGYGDGYPRSAKNGTPVLINGKRVPLVGRVSMDMITVDLRELPAAAIGDEAILWGEGLPVEEVARAADTIAYELLCRVTQRVRFVER